MIIKICGLTTAEDTVSAVAAGAGALGFNFYEKSPRYVTPERAAELAAVAAPGVLKVGVFVNEDREFVQTVADDAGLFAVQIHGDEEPQAFADMPLPVWRAVRIEEGVCRPDPAEWKALRYVVDAAVPGVYGGTGVEADWDSAARLAKEQALMLAGGLNPDNVGEAVRTVHPLGVDTASGVEREPGKKDWDKVRKFVRAAKECGLENG